MPEEPHHILVATGPTRRKFAIGRLRTGRHVVEDLDEDRRLGVLVADLTPFLVTIDDAPHLICAGLRDSRKTHDVVIRAANDVQVCLIQGDVWMSAPMPFTEKMGVTAVWRDADERPLWRRQTPPLDRAALEGDEAERSIFGPNVFAYKLEK